MPITKFACGEVNLSPTCFHTSFNNSMRKILLNKRDKRRRLCWSIAYWLLYRPTPVPMHGWRCAILRFFGAQIGKGVHPYPTSVIWAPWNLELEDHSCIGPGVICYTVDKVHLEEGATVSQRAHLCTASRDIYGVKMALIGAPIKIKREGWVAAEAFIGPGVTIGERAVVLARCVVVSDLEPEGVFAGNPATLIRRRKPK